MKDARLRMSSTSMPGMCFCLFIIMAAGPAGRTHGQCVAVETDMVTPSDGSFGDQYGAAVAVSGGAAIAGAPFSDEAGSDSGSGYIYSFEGEAWVERPKLAPAEAAAGDKCGKSVDVSGDVAIFGAPEDTVAGKAFAGSAYIFRFDGAAWSQDAHLVPSDSTFFQYFGQSVAIDGDTALVGAYSDSQAKGAAYIFRYDGDAWIQTDKLLATDGQTNDAFGMSVSLSGDVALIGAGRDDSNRGSAYIFRFIDDVWFEEAKLVPADLEADDQFGRAVVLAGNLAVAGSWFHNNSTGAVYAFRYDGVSAWSLEQKLTASDGSPSDSFGHSIAVSGDLMIVGAPGDEANGSGSGSAYLFQQEGNAWSERARLMASNGDSFDALGWSVSIEGDVASVGAPGYSTVGSVYVYRGLSDCNANQVLDLCDIAEQSSSDENGNGTPDECECPWDLDGGGVGVTDLLILLSVWLTDPGGFPDFDGDHLVGVTDLLTMLSHWGQCG